MICAILRRRKVRLLEQEKVNRLERAEADLRDLKKRARKANVFLSSRQKRNHWQESVNKIIEGGVP